MGNAGEDLLARFRQFQTRAQQSPPPPPSATAPSDLGGPWSPLATPHGQAWVRREFRLLPGCAEFAPQWADRSAGGALGPPECWRLLDLETTGLSGGAGTRAFLAGIGRLQGDGLQIDQFLLGDVDQEQAFLWAIAEALDGASAMVTFNGRSFDWPLLRDRFVLAALPPPTELAHWDLLHPARRLWGELLGGSCHLTRLQEHILGWPRGQDIPGAWIPALYQAFLQGDRTALDGVLEHNAADLWALGAIAIRLDQALELGPTDDDPAELLWGYARSYERLGVWERALNAYLAYRRRCGDTGATRRRAAHVAASILRRLGRAQESLAIWEEERRGPFGSVEAAIEVAKFLEHRRRDPRAALAVVRQISANPWLGPAHRAEIAHRLDRLERKAATRRGSARPGSAASPDPTGCPPAGGAPDPHPTPPIAPAP